MVPCKTSPTEGWHVVLQTCVTSFGNVSHVTFTQREHIPWTSSMRYRNKTTPPPKSKSSNWLFSTLTRQRQQRAETPLTLRSSSPPVKPLWARVAESRLLTLTLRCSRRSMTVYTRPCYAVLRHRTSFKILVFQPTTIAGDELKCFVGPPLLGRRSLRLMHISKRWATFVVLKWQL